MSLDVWLNEGETDCPYCSECGSCNGTKKMVNTVFDSNITHNLNTMAEEAGIYKHLWRPDELGITKASELIGPLREGLALLEKDPARFEKFNPQNGWGSYGSLVLFVKNYLMACEDHPTADIAVSR